MLLPQSRLTVRLGVFAECGHRCRLFGRGMRLPVMWVLHSQNHVPDALGLHPTSRKHFAEAERRQLPWRQSTQATAETRLSRSEGQIGEIITPAHHAAGALPKPEQEPARPKGWPAPVCLRSIFLHFGDRSERPLHGIHFDNLNRICRKMVSRTERYGSG